MCARSRKILSITQQRDSSGFSCEFSVLAMSGPVLSNRPLLPCPILSYLVLSGRINPMRSCPILLDLVLSDHVPANPVLSYPMRYCPIMSQPILSYHVPANPVLSYPMRSCPIMSQPILSYHVPANPVLSYPSIHRSHPSYPGSFCAVTSYPICSKTNKFFFLTIGGGLFWSCDSPAADFQRVLQTCSMTSTFSSESFVILTQLLSVCVWVG
jgi:hypothetical protein